MTSENGRSAPALKVEGLHKRYADDPVIQGLDLQVAAGERVSIIGRSGAGKTTLLRLVAGLESPDAGSLHIDGRLASGDGRQMPPHQRGIGFVFQSAGLWPHMTVREHLDFAIADLDAADRGARIDTVLELCEIAGLADRHPDQLSGGERRRVALARALAGRPPLLLMDEPFVNLDPDLKERLQTMLGAALDELGSALVYVTHDHDSAARVADRVLTLDQGRLV